MDLTNLKRASLFILTLIIFSLQSAQAQDDESHNKNSIYASYGSVIFSSQASLSYERLFFKRGKYETKAKLN